MNDGVINSTDGQIEISMQKLYIMHVKYEIQSRIEFSRLDFLLSGSHVIFSFGQNKGKRKKEISESLNNES